MLQVGLIEIDRWIDTQLVTTSHYKAIVNSHTLQFTTARTKSPQSVVPSPVFW
jgi:hypothetical protein